MAELIKMPFGMRTRVGRKRHTSNGGPDPQQEGNCGEEYGYISVATSYAINTNNCNSYQVASMTSLRDFHFSSIPYNGKKQQCKLSNTCKQLIHKWSSLCY